MDRPWSKEIQVCSNEFPKAPPQGFKLLHSNVQANACFNKIISRTAAPNPIMFSVEHP